MILKHKLAALYGETLCRAHLLLEDIGGEGRRGGRENGGKTGKGKEDGEEGWSRAGQRYP